MADKNERCVLCLEEKRLPVSIKCGHSFCKECLDVHKSYHKYAWASRCPICRGALKEKRCSVNQTNETSAALYNTTSAATSSATAPIDEMYFLEEFMAIAADSDGVPNDDDDDDNNNFDDNNSDNDNNYDDDDIEFYSIDEQEDSYYFEDHTEYDDDTVTDENDEPEQSDGEVVFVEEVIVVD